MGGTKVALRVEDDNAHAYETMLRWPASGGVEADLRALRDAVRTLESHWEPPILGIGISMPATLDPDGVVAAWPTRPTWVGLDLGRRLREWFRGAAIGLADDGDLAALAESDAIGIRDLVYLGVGTGIGGGAVLDGRSCPGSARGSFELGHMVVERTGPHCDCGRRGCVQAIASGRATLRRAAGVQGRTISYAEFQAATQAGRPWAVAVLQDTCAALATAVLNLDELLHPSCAVIGGGFAAGLPQFVPMVSHCTTELARPGRQPVRVRAATCGGLSSLRGALLLAGARRATQ